MSLLARRITNADEQRLQPEPIANPQRLSVAVLASAHADDAIPAMTASVANKRLEPALKVIEALVKVDIDLVNGKQAGSTPPRLVELAIWSSVGNQAGLAVPHQDHR
jgi:hypothetical protein